MPHTQFFEKKGPFLFQDIVKTIGCSGDFSDLGNLKIYGIESLNKANEKEITFLNSSKYSVMSSKTKAAACITTVNLSKFLPKNCIKLNVKNILFSVTKVSKMFYPKADIDYPDSNLIQSNEVKKKLS
tara:strand:- start:123 stop:506 length:384 start_codon:yes stop_codon:yes gene_type:complete